jgi:TPR repeat protein
MPKRRWWNISLGETFRSAPVPLHRPHILKGYSVTLAILFLFFLLNNYDENVSNNKSVAVSPTRTETQFTPEEKFAKIKRKAEAGDAQAQVETASGYFKGEGVQKDAAKAAEWLQKAVAQGDASAKVLLGYLYSIGEGVQKDAAKAAEWFQKAEAQGDAEALTALGEIHAGGHGVPKDLSKAVELYQKAAAQGYADAQGKLGQMYAKGEGVPKNPAKAAEWFEKEASQGDSNTKLDLGEKYAKGDGVPKDLAKAQVWYRKAAAQYKKDAAQGDAGAQDSLGEMYKDGVGVPKDTAEAVAWFQKSAAQGNEFGQYHLGNMYAEGEGVPKDASKAVEWYQKAAAQGNAVAQYDLANMYIRGDGVSQNFVLAYAWANLAAAQAPELAKTIRDALEAHLTPAQRAEAQRLASNWKLGDVLQAAGDGESTSISPDGKPAKRYTGTAFAVSSGGHALTNYHLVASCTEVKIAGREGVANVLTSDTMNDLALLQLPGVSKDIAHLNPDFGKLRQGDDIVVYGYPLNSVLSSGGNLTPGTISALTGLGNNSSQIQITAPIQPGSSGSPVMDKKGNVVGVVSMKLDDAKMAKATGQIGQNVNFAVNGLTVKAFLDANKVPYKTGGGFFSREKSNADIAEEASKWTVLVECWK